MHDSKNPDIVLGFLLGKTHHTANRYFEFNITMLDDYQLNIDLPTTRLNYQQDNRLRLNQVLPQAVAQQVHACLKNQTAFEMAYTQNGSVKVSSAEQLNMLSSQQQQQLTQVLYQDASQGKGFLYGRYAINDNPQTQQNQVLKQVAAWINSPAMLDCIRAVTGFDDIIYASAQATRYLPGNFLTRHNDLNQQEQRRVAYVLNLTEHWHPDWGGLLQFYQADGTPRDAWSPQFNSLSLFDVSHVHAVTFVTPFAKQPRLAVTGWFRAVAP